MFSCNSENKLIWFLGISTALISLAVGVAAMVDTSKTMVGQSASHQDIHSDICRMSSTKDVAARKLSTEIVKISTAGGVTTEDINLVQQDGTKIPAYFVRPERTSSVGAAVFFIHWLGNPPGNDRSEFLDDARQLATANVSSLLVTAPWVDPQWLHGNRDLLRDREATLVLIATFQGELNALILKAHPKPGLVALVGHDFGGMYGSFLLNRDPRIRYAVIMTAVPDLASWLLYQRTLSGEAEGHYRGKMAGLTPATHLQCSTVSDVLFQFARTDRYVTEKDAQEFVDHAPGKKEARWYDTNHRLDDKARADRVKWLTNKFQGK